MTVCRVNKELMKFLKLDEELENTVLERLPLDLECIIMCEGKKNRAAGDFELNISPEAK